MYIVITGASRGIGLELVNKAVSSGAHVLAVARNPDSSESLQRLKKDYRNLEILKGDLQRLEIAQEIVKAVSKWPMVDVVINNAGVYRDDESLEDFTDSFLINSIMPLMITRALLPSLRKSKNPRSIQITSQMGSIADNTSGGSYSYRASKSALNMLFKSLSVDEPWLLSLLIHPGWVRTRMGGDNAPISTEESVAGIWNILTTAGLRQSGAFLNYAGNTLPW